MVCAILMVAIKYPANPPAVGDPETIYYRQSLYVGYFSYFRFHRTCISTCMEQTAGEIQENHIPVDLCCCNDRSISWNACQPGQNKHIDGTNSDFQDFDSTNYRYVLGYLGCFIWLIVG